MISRKNKVGGVENKVSPWTCQSGDKVCKYQYLNSKEALLSMLLFFSLCKHRSLQKKSKPEMIFRQQTEHFISSLTLLHSSLTIQSFRRSVILVVWCDCCGIKKGQPELIFRQQTEHFISMLILLHSCLSIQFSWNVIQVVWCDCCAIKKQVFFCKSGRHTLSRAWLSLA